MRGITWREASETERGINERITRKKGLLPKGEI
jgi:hypothetical protein